MCSNYVDDLICLTKSKFLRDWWRSNLTKHFAKVTFEDSLDYILGIKINRGVDENGNRYLELDHQASIEKLAEQAGVGPNYRRVTSPMDHATKLRRKPKDDDGSDAEVTPMPEHLLSSPREDAQESKAADETKPLTSESPEAGCPKAF